MAVIVAAVSMLGTNAYSAGVNADMVDGKHAADLAQAVHTHSGADINDGTITTTKVADGAVTDEKITGPISSSKIQSQGLSADTVDGQHSADFAPSSHGHYQSDVVGLPESLAGKADTVHNHDGLYQKKYSGVAVVAKSGGDYTDPLTAIGNVDSWCGTRSSSNPCLIKIMPGLYELLPAAVYISDHITVEGSGRTATILSCNADLPNWTYRACISVGNNVSISNLTVKVLGDPGYGYPGVQDWRYNADAVAFNLRDYNNLSNIDIYATGGTGDIGLRFLGSETEIRNVNVYTDGLGAVIEYLSNGYTKVRASNFKIDGYNGVPPAFGLLIGTSYGDIEVKDSKIRGGVNGSGYVGGIIKAAHSMIGGVLDGTLKLVNCYDEDFNPIANR